MSVLFFKVKTSQNYNLVLHKQILSNKDKEYVHFHRVFQKFIVINTWNNEEYSIYKNRATKQEFKGILIHNVSDTEIMVLKLVQVSQRTPMRRVNNKVIFYSMFIFCLSLSCANSFYRKSKKLLQLLSLA